MSDPLASLRGWKIVVTFGDMQAVIPPRPAAAWIEMVLTGDFGDLFVPDDADLIAGLIADGHITDEQFERAMYDAISAAAGRDWPMALRLCGGLYDTALRGEVLMRLDLATASFAAVLDAIYAIRVRWMKAEDREKFDAELNAPAPRSPGSADPRERMRQQRQLSRERGGAIGGPSAHGSPRTPQSLEPVPPDA